MVVKHKQPYWNKSKPKPKELNQHNRILQNSKNI